MLLPEWNIRLTTECQEKWEALKEKTIRDIHIGAWKPHPLLSIQTPEDELNQLEIFGDKLDKLIQEGRDPFWTMPKHRDPSFDNIFYFSQPPWVCYFYRKLWYPPVALGVLLVHQLDQPLNLRAELEATIARAKAEDDAFRF